MNLEKIKGRLDFLREAERLKDVLRSAHTSSGRSESTAEHSWRLCLMAIVFADDLAGLDVLKVLKMCVIHDLGEAINGDIPAVDQAGLPDKGEQERNDLLLLTRALDDALRNEILALWDDYENASSPEAKAVKALDKLETLLQHTQGKNPPDFDYGFNLAYGKQYTNADPLFETLRTLIDRDTRERMNTNITIRNERPEDIDAIARITEAAFQHEEHSSHTEQFIVNALRRTGQLSVSLVAVENDTVVGHVAISPVTISSGAQGWYGLGPISVCPTRQQQGIGSALMKASLAQLQRIGGVGCVVLGDPGYYGRFGFKAHAGLELPGIPAEYFQALAFEGELPVGVVSYHEAFDATA
jgi:putative hydrolase of HD superfamily